jgi:uncharacterized protein (DUF433 family)
MWGKVKTMLNVPVQHIEIIDGQAFVARQRVKVKMIVNMHLRGGAPIEDVIEQYDLTEAEIYAALTYYYDNKAAFDHQYDEDQALLKQIGISAEEHIAKLHARQAGRKDT